MKKKKNVEKKNKKGAMTVEAIIVLPVFLMLFMFMMYMVNICTAYLTLNHVVDQTSKYNSNSIYVYNTLRSYLDDAGEGNTDIDVKNAVAQLVNGEASLPTTLINFFDAKIKKYAGDLAGQMADGAHMMRTRDFIDDMLEGSEINSDDVEITIYKLPDTEVYGENADDYTEAFDERDLVLQLTYTMELGLPFIGKQDFDIVSTCVEKAWTNGAKTSEYVNFEQTSFWDKISQ